MAPVPPNHCSYFNPNRYAMMKNISDVIEYYDYLCTTKYPNIYELTCLCVSRTSWIGLPTLGHTSWIGILPV